MISNSENLCLQKVIVKIINEETKEVKNFKLPENFSYFKKIASDFMKIDDQEICKFYILYYLDEDQDTVQVANEDDYSSMIEHYNQMETKLKTIKLFVRKYENSSDRGICTGNDDPNKKGNLEFDFIKDNSTTNNEEMNVANSQNIHNLDSNDLNNESNKPKENNRYNFRNHPVLNEANDIDHHKSKDLEDNFGEILPPYNSQISVSVFKDKKEPEESTYSIPDAYNYKVVHHNDANILNKHHLTNNQNEVKYSDIFMNKELSFNPQGKVEIENLDKQNNNSKFHEAYDCCDEVIDEEVENSSKSKILLEEIERLKQLEIKENQKKRIAEKLFRAKRSIEVNNSDLCFERQSKVETIIVNQSTVNNGRLDNGNENSNSIPVVHPISINDLPKDKVQLITDKFDYEKECNFTKPLNFKLNYCTRAPINQDFERNMSVNLKNNFGNSPQTNNDIRITYDDNNYLGVTDLKQIILNDLVKMTETRFEEFKSGLIREMILSVDINIERYIGKLKSVTKKKTTTPATIQTINVNDGNLNNSGNYVPPLNSSINEIKACSGLEKSGMNINNHPSSILVSNEMHKNKSRITNNTYPVNCNFSTRQNKSNFGQEQCVFSNSLNLNNNGLQNNFMSYSKDEENINIIRTNRAFIEDKICN